MIEFDGWPKTPRLNRNIIISEKLDGTNGAIIIEEYDGPAKFTFDVAEQGGVAVVYMGDRTFVVGAQSRNRLVFPGGSTDNHGFARWVQDNASNLVRILGAGRHFGEWWGQGIARKYGKISREFSLFRADHYAPLIAAAAMEGDDVPGLSVVPVLYRGTFSQTAINDSVEQLRHFGSVAAPGFMRPEGVVVFHTASKQVYKVLLENDELPKGLVA